MTPDTRVPTGPAAGVDTGQAGLLLLRGAPPEVSDWVRRGVVPVTVAPLPGWTAVLPNGPSRAEPPYDDALTLLAARHVPPKVAPAIGFFAIGGRAVITVQTRSVRRHVRWVVWDPARGVLRPPDLAVAPPQLLLRAAGGGDRRELVEILAERHLAPHKLLAAVTAVLGLPGGRLLIDRAEVEDIAGAIDREPLEREVGYFEDAVKDSVRLRRELELEA